MTESWLTNPHDHFFKSIFSRQESARDFLRHYLPAEVMADLDVTELEISHQSFIDAELREHFTDLLYKVRLKDGKDALIYVLFEHKSYSDRLVAFQLLRYMVRIWEHSLSEGESLSPILPLVIYHGRAKWSISLNFSALFDAPTSLQPYLPDYRYWLCDLSQYSDAEIRGEVDLRVGLLLLKYILRDDLRLHLGEILGLLKALSDKETGLEYLETILRYVSGASDRITEIELREAVIEIFLKEGENVMPTIAEKWVEQGIEQGEAHGREAALKVLNQFLLHRFDPLPDRLAEELDQLDLEAIVQLSSVAAQVSSLAEFETELTTFKTDDA